MFPEVENECVSDFVFLLLCLLFYVSKASEYFSLVGKH